MHSISIELSGYQTKCFPAILHVLLLFVFLAIVTMRDGSQSEAAVTALASKLLLQCQVQVYLFILTFVYVLKSYVGTNNYCISVLIYQTAFGMVDSS